jgi:hypothetical protein
LANSTNYSAVVTAYFQTYNATIKSADHSTSFTTFKVAFTTAFIKTINGAVIAA